MENENTGTENTGTATVESINAQIDQVRGEQKPFQHSRRADTRLNDLYRQRQGLIDGNESGNENTTPGQETDGNREPSRPNDEAALEATAEKELETLRGLGVDTGDVDGDYSPERVEGLTHLRLIEEGKLHELRPLLSRAATKAGLPPKSEVFLREFFDKVADPGDELSNDILRVISNYIFQARKGQ